MNQFFYTGLLNNICIIIFGNQTKIYFRARDFWTLFLESLSDERDQYSSHTVQIKNNPFFLGITALCFLQPYNNSWFVIDLRSARNKLSSIVFLSTEVYRMLASYKEELNFGSRRTSFNFRLKSGIGLLDLLKSLCLVFALCYILMLSSRVFHWAKKWNIETWASLRMKRKEITIGLHLKVFKFEAILQILMEFRPDTGIYTQIYVLVIVLFDSFW